MNFLSSLPLWVSLAFMLIGLITIANIRELKSTKFGQAGANAGILFGVIGIILGFIQLGIYVGYWPGRV